MLGPHLRVLPVEVGLLGREEVEVPLAVADARPGRAAEDRLPAVRRQLAVLAGPGPEPEALAGRRSRGRGERLPEPRVLVRDVVRDDVDDRADAERPRLRDQLLGFPQRPERGIDRAVIRDVVAGVGERRRVPRVEPERVDAERGEIGKAIAHPGEVADPVAVRVGEAPDVDLVDDRLVPPRALDRGCSGSRSGAAAFVASVSLIGARA